MPTDNTKRARASIRPDMRYEITITIVTCTREELRIAIRVISARSLADWSDCDEDRVRDLVVGKIEE